MNFPGFFPFMEPKTLSDVGIRAIAEFNPHARFASPEFLGNRKLTVEQALEAFRKGMPIVPVFGNPIGFVQE